MIVPNYENTSLEQAIPWSMIFKSKTNHKELIEKLLENYSWQINPTAKYLGVSWTGLKNKMNREGINIPVSNKRNMTAKIKSLNTENMTAEEISSIVGCTRRRVVDLCRIEDILYKKYNLLLNLHGCNKPKINPFVKEIEKLDHCNMNSAEIAKAVGCKSVRTISYLCRVYEISYVKRGRYKNTIEKGE